MLKALAKLLAVLGSQTDPGQIALGAVLGMVAGLTPLAAPHNLLVLLLLLVLRANLSAFLVVFAAGSGLAYLADPLFHAVGLALLTAGPLQGLWTALYGVPALRLTRFNNSIVLGSVVLCLVLAVPVFLLCRAGVVRYRERVLARMRSLRVVQALTASRLFRLAREAAREWQGR
jgi:uncharacterized protein (TIGR03546 family)